MAAVRADVLAGLTAAAVVAPKAMAYATIAGLPVQVGLYTGVVPMIVYAVLGTSRPLSVSTTTTIAILRQRHWSGRAERNRRRLIAGDGDARGAGRACCLLASAIRLGFVANFISEPVLTGFKSGIGLVIVVDQIPKLLGIHIDEGRIFRDIVRHRPEAPVDVTGDGAGRSVDGRADLRAGAFAPRAPAPLMAIGLAIGASAAFEPERVRRGGDRRRVGRAPSLSARKSISCATCGRRRPALRS